MSNRFAGRIKSGEIASVESLKAEFKALAKATHPDLGGVEASGEEFARVRDEYENALRDFEKHRFGFRGASRKAGSDRHGGMASVAAAEAWSAEVIGLFAALGLLRKRGFPKSPRHEKERMRYDYARYRFEARLGALGEGGLPAFEAFEAALFALRRRDAEAATSVLSLVDELLDYAMRRLPPMRTALVLSMGALSADPRMRGELRSFLVMLASGLGIGPTLG